MKPYVCPWEVGEIRCKKLGESSDLDAVGLSGCYVLLKKVGECPHYRAKRKMQQVQLAIWKNSVPPKRQDDFSNLLLIRNGNFRKAKKYNYVIKDCCFDIASRKMWEASGLELVDVPAEVISLPVAGPENLLFLPEIYLDMFDWSIESKVKCFGTVTKAEVDRIEKGELDLSTARFKDALFNQLMRADLSKLEEYGFDIDLLMQPIMVPGETMIDKSEKEPSED